MDMKDLSSRKILIRLADSGDGFVATVRNGFWSRRSEIWPIALREEAAWGARVDDPPASEECSGD